ncbi:uncharacterized protein SCODWIG_00908 [Saccharomycodes ludwigii]|uniref:RING-type domain-containing protein n=1 Tax=Saccharomycodes ludwigii TaxID=36035 RepID=A0A376B395_9ASCO|nr:hypothetical protein SCDLUD_000522 [Saccharomycodes ludwigii]KAH3902926.1 hypothetical protein SCDLUD_000522 [Saccharomycodes ludwigii]SSD59147.1 uncharacterized protein SCODWIG_00908 [Saccharomycodes ludwigii]
MSGDYRSNTNNGNNITTNINISRNEKYTGKNIEVSEYNDTICVICLEPIYEHTLFKSKETIKIKEIVSVLLPCRHEYHQQCLHKWFDFCNASTNNGNVFANTNIKCPTCRSRINEEEQYTISTTHHEYNENTKHVTKKFEKKVILDFEYFWINILSVDRIQKASLLLMSERKDSFNGKSKHEDIIIEETYENMCKFTRTLYHQNKERERKEKLCNIVRGILDPIYYNANHKMEMERSTAFSKKQYKQINEKVSRILYKTSSKNHKELALKLCESEISGILTPKQIIVRQNDKLIIM